MRKVMLLPAVLGFIVHVQAQNTSPYWSLAGNANASTSSKLGTTNGVSLRFYAGNVQRMVIAYTTGNVGIGTSTLPARFTVQGKGSTPSARWVSSSSTPLFAGFGEGTSGSADFVLAAASGSASVRPVLLGRRSRGTLAAPTIVANNDNLATLLASGYDGAAFQNGASMDFQVDGTPASGKVPTRISFYTGANAGTRTERLRIASNGNVGIGTSTPMYKLDVVGKGGINASNVDNTTDASGVRASGSGYGVYAEADGVLDEDNGFLLGGTGVFATTRGDYGSGVEGKATDDYGTGVVGIGSTVEGTGVIGQGTIGVIGQSLAPEGVGVQGDAFDENSIGVKGTSTYSVGVYGSTGNEKSYAGYFNGNVYTTGVYTPSDKKLKENITDLNKALDLIAKLHPKQYAYKQAGTFKQLQLPVGAHYGLLAEELEETLPTLVKETAFAPGLSHAAKRSLNRPVQKAQTDGAESIVFKAINYIELVPVLVKGMQEQQAQIVALQEKASRVDELEARVKKLETLLGNNRGTSITSATLEQNTPNPVRGSTTIRYHVPERSAAARLEFTNAKGQVVKTVTITGSGQTTFNTSQLAAGTYNYTLYVDGIPADTKRLVVVR